jgi:O-antigen/teichoic acid export membrane protein
MLNVTEYMMYDNLLKKLVKQVSMYFSSGVIITLTGLISFPIWTRAFSEAEYGKMSLAIVTLGLILVISKFGIPRAALRFYSEFKEKKRDLDISYYYTTAFLSVLVISSMTAGVFLTLVAFYPGIQFDLQFTRILRILAILIIFDSLISIFLLFLRAEQNVKLHSLIRISRRYSKLIVTLLFVLVFNLGLSGFFIGCALADGFFALILGIIFFRQGKINLKNFSNSLLKESISYGLPLIGFELSALLLTAGDRFLVQYFLGSSAVGVYSAASNLTKYLVDIFAEPMKLAVTPIFMSIWEKKGKEDTQHFLSSVLKIYFMIGIPIIFAVSFMGRDLIVLLASNKFEEGYIILPFIVTGYVIHKANFICGAGLYLMKKTKTLLLIIFISAIINIFLNIKLIPIFGLMGASITTLSAFIFELILLVSISFRAINFKIPVYPILKYVAISIIMVFVMLNINNLGSPQTIIRIFAGFLTYLSGIVILETDVRTKAVILLNKVFAK